MSSTRHIGFFAGFIVSFLYPELLLNWLVSGLWVVDWVGEDLHPGCRTATVATGKKISSIEDGFMKCFRSISVPCLAWIDLSVTNELPTHFLECQICRRGKGGTYTHKNTVRGERKEEGVSCRLIIETERGAPHAKKQLVFRRIFQDRQGVESLAKHAE